MADPAMEKPEESLDGELVKGLSSIYTSTCSEAGVIQSHPREPRRPRAGRAGGEVRMVAALQRQLPTCDRMVFSGSHPHGV
jgi:hypothetical protein